MLLGLAAFAQYDFPKFEVAVDYSYARFSPSHNYIKNSYSLNGGGGSFEYNFGYLGVKAEFEGYGSSTQNFSAPAGSTFCPDGCTANVQGNLFTYLFGPQVGLRTGKFRPFGELLFGGAHSKCLWKYIEDSRHHDWKQGAVVERIRDDGGRWPGHYAEPVRFDRASARRVRLPLYAL